MNVAYRECAIAGITESDKTVSLQDKITLGIGTTKMKALRNNCGQS